MTTWINILTKIISTRWPSEKEPPSSLCLQQTTKKKRGYTTSCMLSKIAYACHYTRYAGRKLMILAEVFIMQAIKQAYNAWPSRFLEAENYSPGYCNAWLLNAHLVTSLSFYNRQIVNHHHSP